MGVRERAWAAQPGRWVGLAVVLGGLAALLHDGWQLIGRTDPRIVAAGAAGCIAALATALGTLPVLLQQRHSERTRDAMLGFGAGVMLAACSFSLIVPALAAATAQGASRFGAAGIVGASVLIGAGLMLLLEKNLPHEHFIKGQDRHHAHARALKRTWLFVFAIALHNLPEGLAIGVAYGGTDALAASALATGIAIQDVPEGLVIAVALHAAGYPRRFAVALGAASGLVEPVGAVLGAALITLTGALLPWGLAFAAGAMLFVVSHEIIPESHRTGHEHAATGGLVLGFALMMVLDTALV
ncbi:MAG TPA: ZIP family metal transporter [Methylibium sp.]|uniref:ZIP family metal transporter n=1 Tax=Methylibium sp. TaxID=2067992 RepID=UPI002DBF8026|nr:ZIP family metal transporter [Methylibium sp.]HEU4458050.1 ZIP family metal transporter [Methylibium sp.]